MTEQENSESVADALPLILEIQKRLKEERTFFVYLMKHGNAMQCLEESIRYILRYLDDDEDATDETALESSYILQERARELIEGEVRADTSK